MSFLIWQKNEIVYVKLFSHPQNGNFSENITVNANIWIGVTNLTKAYLRFHIYDIWLLVLLSLMQNKLKRYYQSVSGV